jgi:hypothetical protein
MATRAQRSASHGWHSHVDCDRSRQPRTISLLSALGSLCLILCFQFPLRAQEPARITFSFDFPGSEPDHYAISISAEGRATYDSHIQTNQGSEENSFHFDFTISPLTLTRIFDLAKLAHYFEGDVDSKKRGMASTGIKTLKYTDAQRNTQATYNYSRIPAVQELTDLLQKLSTTLEFGRRLEYDHHYQKLALDDELKRMEEMSKQNGLEELSAVSPILQRIAADATVINPVRVRAQRLIAEGRKESR